jgi:hypothetical protein
MNAANSGNGGFKSMIRIILLILVFVALYYLYKYLFTTSGMVINELNGDIISANTKDSDYAIAKQYPIVPSIYTGGEMTVSTWIYVADWQTINQGRPKHILTLGKGISPEGKSGETDKEQTLVLFLDSYNNDLNVVVSCTVDPAAVNSTNYSIKNSEVNSHFAKTGTKIGTALSSKVGKSGVKDIELQKWILCTVCINNKILDIYMDGKLARSTALPSMYSVDPSTDSLQVNMAGYGGFGGFIGRTVISNYAMNPQEVWKMYMSGPGAEPSVGGAISALFNPDTYKSLTFPTL